MTMIANTVFLSREIFPSSRIDVYSLVGCMLEGAKILYGASDAYPGVDGRDKNDPVVGR